MPAIFPFIWRKPLVNMTTRREVMLIYIKYFENLCVVFLLFLLPNKRLALDISFRSPVLNIDPRMKMKGVL